MWFAARKVAYGALGDIAKSRLLVVTSLVGAGLLLIDTPIRLLGFALLVPFTQVMMLVATSRLFEYFAGEPLQHVQLHAFSFAGRSKHAFTDLLASLLAVSAPIYILRALFLRDP